MKKTVEAPWRCAIYARVSTATQRERHTIGSQLRILPEHAKKSGWKIVDIYTDDGRSGETVEGRPAFQRLLDDVEGHKIDVILVIDLDRITRSKRSAEGALIYDTFREHKVKVATPNEVIDLENEDQDLVAGIKREVAKWEKRKILRRMTNGKKEALLRSGRVTSIIPYGYRWVRDVGRAGKVEIDPIEGPIVRRIYDLARQGMGASMIACTLTSEGHKTRPMKRATRPKGGAGSWGASSIKKILASPTYKGQRVVRFRDGDEIAVPFPLIVPVDQWDDVRKLVALRRSDTKWKHDREYLLANVLTCGTCGRRMWVANKRQDRGYKTHAYYRCSSTNGWRTMGLQGPCGQPSQRVGPIDAAVWEKLVVVLKDPTLLREACSVSMEAKGVDWGAQAAAAERVLSRLVKLETDALALHRRKLLSASGLEAELKGITKDRTIAEKNLKVARRNMAAEGARQAQVANIEAQARALSKGLASASFEARRKLVLLLVAPEHGGKVTLDRHGGIEIEGLLPLEEGAIDLKIRA